MYEAQPLGGKWWVMYNAQPLGGNGSYRKFTLNISQHSISAPTQWSVKWDDIEVPLLKEYGSTVHG